MRTNMITLSLVSVCVMVFMAGCGARQAIVKDRYLIQVQRAGDPEAMSDVVVTVMPFTIAPEFKSNGFVYRTGTSKYETDYYNEYHIPPVQMISGQVQNWLESSGMAHVVSPTSSVAAKYCIEGTVRKLYGDAQESMPPKAVLEISFVIYEQNKAEAQIRFSKVYQAETEYVHHTPTDYIQAMDQSLRQILMQLEKDLRERAAQ